MTANSSTMPGDDSAMVHFTLFTNIGGVDTETEFQSLCERLNGRYSNQTIDAMINLPAGSLVYLAMKSDGKDQITTVQFISMNIVRIKDSQ